MLYDRGQQTMAHRPDSAHYLFSAAYNLRIFFLYFKQSKQFKKEIYLMTYDNYMKIKSHCP